MQIMIDLPEKTYNEVCWQGLALCPRDKEILIKAIKNGIKLPKSHGRLIDVDALKMDKRVCGDRYLSKTSLFVANKVIEQAPTIIEADKENNYADSN